ncbi:MAG: C40 family peptidase, partial [Spirochaetia bacterium]|nr:C40 family peptidase [Spirochaetia bacterium]
MRRFLSAFLLISVMLLTSCETLPPIFDCPAVKQKQEKQAEQAKKAPAENTVAAPKQEPKASKEPSKSANTSPSTSPNSNTSISQRQKQLVDAANWAKGRNYLTINGHRFKMDCSGVVRAIYFKAGIDLAKDFNKYKGGGTQRIHETLRSKGLIYRPTVPVPGDILFWDNTYDANHNG